MTLAPLDMSCGRQPDDRDSICSTCGAHLWMRAPP